VSFVYPFGLEWLNSNRGDLANYHKQGTTFGSLVGYLLPLQHVNSNPASCMLQDSVRMPVCKCCGDAYEMSKHHRETKSDEAGEQLQGCITHRHVDAVDKKEHLDSEERAVLRQFLGQPVPPGPTAMNVDQRAEKYLMDRLP
jgi:hypothetical protein